MTSRLETKSIMTAMIGTEIAPLITALQKSVLIGWMSMKSNNTPASVDAAMIS